MRIKCCWKEIGECVNWRNILKVWHQTSQSCHFSKDAQPKQLFHRRLHFLLRIHPPATIINGLDSRNLHLLEVWTLGITTCIFSVFRFCLVESQPIRTDTSRLSQVCLSVYPTRVFAWQSGDKRIWWLCLVPTSATRFANDLGYRLARNSIGLNKTNAFFLKQWRRIP